MRGECEAGAPIRRLSLIADGYEHQAIAWAAPAARGGYGFWCVVPLGPPPRSVELGIAAELGSGRSAGARLGTIGLEQSLRPAAQAPPAPGPDSEPLIAVCLATFDPPAELFERQIASLRAQAHRNWVCVVSDDGSSNEAYSVVEATIQGDERFRVARSSGRIGFYRNFERALAMVPPAARFVAFADQDDRWHPDKLSTLVSAIGDAQLVYSDARAVRADGTVLSESLWAGRRNNRTNLASLLLSNTVTGAASLFRRELLDLVLPLPPAPGVPYHDHWTALVALATGEVAHVDRPLFDYVQHTGAVLGYEAIGARAELSRVRRLRRLSGAPADALERWRDAYFDEWCRTVCFAEVLNTRCGELMTAAKRRGLARILAGESSARTLAWLAARPARGLVGRNETKHFEHRLLRGILWRRLASLLPPPR